MKKFIFNLIFILLVSIQGYSQSGLGYLNYRVIKTQNGNGTTWTYNGVTYGGMVDNATEFAGMLDLSNPANTLMSSGEVLSNSAQGLNAGSAPGRPNDYFVVEYTGWFYAELAGRYLFYTYSDDAAQVSIGGNVIGGKYGGPGASGHWITLEADTWYPLQFLYHENAGGSYGYLQVYGPRNGYFIPGGANDVYKVSNQAPVYPHKLDVTYNLKSTLDKTKFNSWISYQSLGTETSPSPLSSNGVKSYDSNGNGLDESVYPNGNKKATTVGGTVEWGVLYDYSAAAGRHTLLIDRRELPAGLSAEDVTQLQLFDLWDGVVSYHSTPSTTWAYYYIYTDTPIDASNSTFSSYIRDAGSYLGLKAEFSFEDITGFTPHDIHLGMDETYFTTTYPDMITIADVAKGFSQLTNQTDTPNGPQGGIFTSDVEFILGDVNKDNTFDFLDTQMLLQHIAGDTSPFTNNTVSNSMFMFDGDYTNSTTSNWPIHRPTSKHFTHNLDENNKNKTKSIDVAFLGDLNFSHSSTLQSVNISFSKSPRISFSAKPNSENSVKLNVDKVGDFINVSIDIPQNTSNIIGSQFKVYFDESRVEYQSVEYSNIDIPNFSSQRGNYINIGSFSSDELINLNGGITYTIKFKLKEQLETTLGLVSVGFSELVDKDGNTINWRIE